MSIGSPESALDTASARARVQVRTLTDTSDLRQARRVFDAVWPSSSTQIQSNLMRALIHAGGHASAAYREGEMIAATLAFVGRHRKEGRWHVHLHSHMAAVLEPYRDQHIGTALKMHQRVWALDHELDTIVWTFDPLVRRNAVLNLVKLGVDAEGYEVDFYGSMDDEINADDASDRLFAWWRLNAANAQAAAHGGLPRLEPAELIVSGRDVIEIELPDDIVALRAQRPLEAAQWRVAVREAFLAAFADGFRIIGVSATDGYVLERQP